VSRPAALAAQARRHAGGAAAAARRHGDLLFLVGVVLAMFGLCLGWTAHQASTTRTEIQRQERQFEAGLQRGQASQRRQGVAFEMKLCSTFGLAASLKPPAGNPVRNPSRAYLQGQHAVWTDVLGDLRCGQLAAGPAPQPAPGFPARPRP
jgi:hypothetical protein